MYFLLVSFVLYIYNKEWHNGINIWSIRFDNTKKCCYVFERSIEYN